MLLELDCVIGQQKKHALIDSGATHSFASKQLINFLSSSQVTEVHAQQLDVSLADGSVVPSDLAIKLDLIFPTAAFDDYEQSHEFRVVPQLNHDVILGMDWLKKYQPDIDWKKLQVILGEHVLKSSTAKRDTVVELCSLNSLLKTVQSERAEAWIVLVRKKSELPVVADPQLDLFCARRCRNVDAQLLSINGLQSEQ